MTLTQPPDDPVFVHSRREAMVILGVWALSFAWTVPYCYLNGYQPLASPDDLEIVFGIPSWVFWGIAVPWLISGLISIALCLWFIRDDDLGQSPDETTPATHPD